MELLKWQIDVQQRQIEEERKQTEVLIAAFIGHTDKREQSSPNSNLTDKKAQVFLTNQSRVNYKLLSNLASQQSPAKDINALTLEEIFEYLKDQFDPTQYLVRQQFKYLILLVPQARRVNSRVGRSNPSGCCHVQFRGH